jgi:hypothetical protein
MQFTPKTAAEIEIEKAKSGAWPKGVYDFEVADAQDSISKSGNEMIVLDLLVYNQHGHQRKMKDWLLELMPVKLHQACQSVGLHAEYEQGTVQAHFFVGRSGKLHLGIDKKEGFDDRNKVTGYVPVAPTPKGMGRPQAVARPAPRANVDLNDEVPFMFSWQ